MDIARLYLRAGRGTAIALLAFTLGAAAVPAGTSLLTKAVIDGAAAGQLASEELAGLVCLAIMAAILPGASEYSQNELNRRVNRHCLSRLFQAINQFKGLGRFEDPEYLDRIRMAESAAGPSVNVAVIGAFSFVRSVVTIAGLAGVLLTINQVLAVLVVLAGIPGLVAEMSLSDKRIEIMHRLASTERRRQFFASVLTDAQAAKEVRLFGIERYLHDRMLLEIGRVQAGERSLDRRGLRVQALMGTMGAAVAAGGLVWAAARTSAGWLSLGDMSAFLVAVTGVQGAVQGLIDGVAQTREAVKMHRYFSDVVHASPDLPISAVHSRCPPLRHGIEIRDVWFRYVDDGPWILRGLSLTLVRGCTTALVGLNGAGKTTLVKLLCRFYDPTHGSILWDGIDLRELPVDEVRQRLSVLFQDYMTWDLTARENIALSDVARIDDRTAIVETARSVGLDARLSQLPNGYDTVLGRTFASDQFLAGAAPGAELSGGQWQRLAIARALFRSTRDLTISDEPSAFLDPLAEQQVAQAALSRGPASTHLVVSHRLSTIRQADLVVVLEDGCIVESGTHAELVVQRGRYAHFFESQLVENNLTSPRNGARD